MKLAFGFLLMFFVAAQNHSFAQQNKVLEADKVLESSDNIDVLNLILSVNIECVLRASTKATCKSFTDSFFSENGTVVKREDNASLATVTLKLTDEAVDAQNVRYNFAWKSKDKTGISDFILPLILNQSSLDSVSVLNLLIANAGKGVSLFLPVKTVQSKNGQLVIIYQPKDDGSTDQTQETTFDRLGKSPFVMAITGSVSGNMRGTGAQANNSLSVPLSLSTAYLKEKYLVRLKGYYYFNKQTVPGATESVTNSYVQRGMGSIYVYSMAKKWSVAVIRSDDVDKNSNIELASTNAAGVEWSLVPFRTTENKELAFRVGGSHETLKLTQENELDHKTERYLAAFAKIYYYWVVKNGDLTVTGTLGLDQNLKYRGYEKFSWNNSFAYQISKATRASLNVNYSYSAKTLTYPKMPDFSNPLKAQTLTGQAGRNLFFSIGLNFTVGNTLKNSRERRWADALN